MKMKIRIATGAAACVTAGMLLPTMTFAQESAVVVERDSSQTVRAGERYEFDVQITNQADVPVRDVEMTEFLLNGENKDKQESKSIPLLKAGESRSMTISGIAREEGQIQSCLSVDYTPSVCADVDVVKPDLSIECDMESPQQTPASMQGSDDMNVIYACETVNIACRVTNEGSGATREAELIFDQPDGIDFQEGEASIAVASISPNGEEEYTYHLAANQPGDYSLTPRLKTETGMAEARPIEFRVVQPELELAMQSPHEEFISRPVSYMLHLRNPGDVPVPNTRLDLDEPGMLENVSISSEVGGNDEGMYEFGTLEPGASRTLNIQGDAVEPGMATLSAVATGYCVQDLQKTAEVDIKGVAALVLSVVDEVDPVVVDGETVYDITVKNQGSAPADKIKIAGTLGDQFQFVNGEGESEISGDGSAFDFGAIENLEPGEAISWTVTAKANEAGYARLNLELQSTATKRVITAQEPTRVIE